MTCDMCGKPAVVLLAISRDEGIKRVEYLTRRCDSHRDTGIQRRDHVRPVKVVMSEQT
ncbi:MAG: hypothetical protein M3P18_06965 [Actinomycetota bacterium]|nr:hypothetical protein [Actinomycetota bacterium]